MKFNIDYLMSFFNFDSPVWDILGFLFVFFIAALIIRLLAHIILGKESSINHAISASLGILCIYFLAATIYALGFAERFRFIGSLPFLDFSEGFGHLFSLRNSSLGASCNEVMALLVLVFLYNLVLEYLPAGKGVFGKFFFRLLCAVITMVLYYVIIWLSNAVLPLLMGTYAPTILLVVLIVMLLMGTFKLILGLILAVINPFFAILYWIFSSNKFGKQLSRTMLTTSLLCVVALLMEYCGLHAFTVSPSAYTACIPLFLFLLICFLLWRFIKNRI